MGLLDFFRSKPAKPAQPAPPSGRQRSFNGLCYDIAYFVLPEIAFQDAGKLHDLWTKSPGMLPGFLFFSAGQRSGMDVGAADDGGRFKLHHGKVDANTTYYAIEFPAPPPFDPEEGVLGPHFAAVLRNAKSVEYFILGQGLDAGTTLRSVNAQSMNMNLGPGPAPTLEGFIEAIRQTRV